MPRKKFAAALAAVAAVVSLTGCDTEVYGTEDAPQDPYSVEFLKYRGETLHCAEGSGRISGCDYMRFYAEHPELLEQSKELGELKRREQAEQLEESSKTEELPESDKSGEQGFENPEAPATAG